jgi:sugar O-acyltransferase (sialic acid O-acetyltransferase NeuD family)
MVKDIAIVGASGFAREVAWLIRDINEEAQVWNLIGHIDATFTGTRGHIGESMIIGDDAMLMSYPRDLAVAIGIGDPKTLLRLRDSLARNNRLLFPNLMHPSVLCDWPRVKFGRGNIVCAGNILTTDIVIGSFNVLNLACTYGHDVHVGDCCVINPGCNVSGGVRVGDGCLLGTGSKVLQNVTIGPGATVGGGALVNRDVPPGVTAVGVPARPLPSN